MTVDRKLIATTVQTPKSSVKSSLEDDWCCSTHCRRDANCKCDICIASFNATLDLLPMSGHRSSHTKLFSSKPKYFPQTLNFCNPSTVSTPESETSRLMVSPPLNSTRRTDFRKKIKRKKMEFGYGVMMMKLVFVLFLILVGKLGIQFVASRVVKTKLSPEMVRTLSEKSQGFHDVKERLGFLNGELQDLVGNGVPESSSTNPNCEIVQDGLILRSHCQLYKSGVEEVSIWGWPLQTAGLLTTKFTSRSFTILSGRVTEWSNGESSCLIRKANTSWEQEKWSASLWRLDENTWILEYKRSFVFENTFSSAMEFLKFGMMRAFQWMKQLQRLSAGFVDGNHLTPT